MPPKNTQIEKKASVINRLVELLERTPFVPFTIHMSDGEEHEVPTANHLSITKKLREIIFEPDEPRIYNINPLHVSSIEWEPSTPGESPGSTAPGNSVAKEPDTLPKLQKCVREGRPFTVTMSGGWTQRFPSAPRVETVELSPDNSVLVRTADGEWTGTMAVEHIMSVRPEEMPAGYTLLALLKEAVDIIKGSQNAGEYKHFLERAAAAQKK